MGGGGQVPSLRKYPFVYMFLSPVFHSSSASVSFFLHPLTVSPTVTPVFFSFWTPCNTPASVGQQYLRKLPNFPADSLLSVHWKWTTESIKWCGKGGMVHKGSAHGWKILRTIKGFLYLCCVSWDGLEQCNCPSHFYCFLHFNQGFHTIPPSSHPPPLQSVSLPVTLILLWRLLTGWTLPCIFSLGLIAGAFWYPPLSTLVLFFLYPRAVLFGKLSVPEGPWRSQTDATNKWNNKLIKLSITSISAQLMCCCIILISSALPTVLRFPRT